MTTPPHIAPADPASPYDRFSRVAGDLTQPTGDGAYRVRFQRLPRSHPVRSFLLVLMALLFVGGFLVWLMLPAHWPEASTSPVITAVSIAMTVSTGLIGWFAFLNVATLARATLLARDPIPVRSEEGIRVAFLTTIVPGAEPLETVRPTIEAALKIRHDGPFDVWLLDEGDDPEVKELCERIGVRHFTRRGVERWNLASGPHKARSKHGNYNAWLEAHGENYDVFLSVDPDHVPLPNFAERFLGFFRDSDVAFVVGPQVYGNIEHFIVRAAESQQFVFHSLLQRAGNHSRTPMLVGTNNAVRIEALRSIGGLQDSVTEDMATSLLLHASRNEATGRRWTSVYTPDVVAIGEGPESFTDYFSQQARWSRGTDQVLLRRFWRVAPRLGPRAFLQYALLMCYYPTAAVAWILGAFNGIAYFTLGAGGVVVPGQHWLMLYADAAALQVGLYVYNRRHNVSPHEGNGTAGATGMFISALSTPVYVTSLVAEVLGRKSSFVTTPKGVAGNRDSLATFRSHLRWSAVFGLPLLLSFPLSEHDHLAMRVWSLASLLICLLPVAIWQVSVRRARRAEAEATSRAARARLRVVETVERPTLVLVEASASAEAEEPPLQLKHGGRFSRSGSSRGAAAAEERQHRHAGEPV